MSLAPNSILKTALWVCCILFLCPNLRAQVELRTQLARESAELSLEQRWELKSADEALKLGLLSLAQPIYQRIFKTLDAARPQDKNGTSKPSKKAISKEKLALRNALKDELALKLATTFIAQHEPEQAQSWLERIHQKSTDSFALHQAFVAWQNKDTKARKKWFKGIELKALPKKERPWFFLLQSIIFRSEDKSSAAEEALEQARLEALSPAQLAQIEALSWRERVSASDKDAELEPLLKRQLRDAKDPAVIAELAEHLAIVQIRLNQTKKAIQTLVTQIRYLGESNASESARLKFLVALLKKAETPEGQLALRRILEASSNPPSIQQLALSLMLKGARASKDRALQDNFYAFIDTLIATGKHQIHDDLLLLRAQFRISARQAVEAYRDLDSIIEATSSPSLRISALWMRAYLSWEQKRYRAAADDLSKVHQNLSASSERIAVMELMGDCYYLNKDYSIAAGVYALMLQENKNHPHSGRIFFKAVASNIAAEAYSAAIELFDAFKDEESSTDYWKARWNLLDALRRSGKIHLAFEQVLKNLKVPSEFQNRFHWLRARLTFDKGEYRKAAELAEALHENTNSGGAAGVRLASNTLLLQGQALIRLGEFKKGLAIMHQLQADYPGSDPAIFSYLEESHHFALQFKLADAVGRLRELADKYRDSPHAPTALYEAAILAQRQNLQASEKEAINILNDLVQRYPRHPLVFYARLLQGNIARNLSKLATAQEIFEALIRDYPNHPEVYLAELYRVNTLLARSGSTINQLQESALALERLLGRPDLSHDVKVEVAFTLALTLMRQSKRDEAKAALWLAITRFLREPDSAQKLGARGRYWMSRCLLTLGEMLEQGSDEGAEGVYKLIGAHGLPGVQIASARLRKLGKNLNQKSSQGE